LIYLLLFESISDKDKFEYLYNRHKRLMLYKAYEILHDYQLAEDAASEAFLRIYKNLHKVDLEDMARTTSFAVTIVKNVALTMLQKQKRMATEPELFDEDMPDPADIENDTIAKLQSEALLRVVDSLGADLRDVFLLRYAHGYSNKEIGELVKIPEKHVAVRLFRAKKKLSELLRKEGYADEAG
jgi:RNA polymerase sigma-70 factor (ECF subfamily)